MKQINFKECVISELHNLYGGGFATDGGEHPNGFCYDSDYSTWEPGATQWQISYYGVLVTEVCPCLC